MTDEQIEQKAEEYADKKAETVANFQRNPVVEDFIAGAHSRDEEIEKIKEGKCSLRRSLHRRISALVKEIDGLEDELKKLRNPWISVEDRLPEKDETDLDCVISELSIEVLVASDEYPHRALAYYDYQYKKWRMSNSPLESIKGVTHWMPIPQLKKGE